jgi:hypothetical protein
VISVIEAEKLTEYLDLLDNPDWSFPTLGDFLIHITGLCECGTNTIQILLEQVLREVAIPDENRQSLSREPAIELAAKVLDEAGLLEHGSSISWPWLSRNGRLVISRYDTR